METPLEEGYRVFLSTLFNILYQCIFPNFRFNALDLLQKEFHARVIGLHSFISKLVHYFVPHSIYNVHFCAPGSRLIFHALLDIQELFKASLSVYFHSVEHHPSEYIIIKVISKELLGLFFLTHESFRRSKSVSQPMFQCWLQLVGTKFTHLSPVIDTGTNRYDHKQSIFSLYWFGR